MYFYNLGRLGNETAVFMIFFLKTDNMFMASLILNILNLKLINPLCVLKVISFNVTAYENSF